MPTNETATDKMLDRVYDAVDVLCWYCEHKDDWLPLASLLASTVAHANSVDELVMWLTVTLPVKNRDHVHGMRYFFYDKLKGMVADDPERDEILKGLE